MSEKSVKNCVDFGAPCGQMNEGACVLRWVVFEV